MSSSEQVRAFAKADWEAIWQSAEWPDPPATRWAAVRAEVERHLHNARMRLLWRLQRPEHRDGDRRCRYHRDSAWVRQYARNRGRAGWYPERYTGPPCQPCATERLAMAHRREWLQYGRHGAFLRQRSDGVEVLHHGPPS